MLTPKTSLIFLNNEELIKHQHILYDSLLQILYGPPSSSSHHTQTRIGMYNSTRHSHEKKITNSFVSPTRQRLAMVRSLFSCMLFIPTSIFLVVLIVLLAYNSFNIFYIHVPPSLPLSNSSSSPSSSLVSFSSLETTIVFPKDASMERARKLHASSTLKSLPSVSRKRRKHRRKYVEKPSSSPPRIATKDFSQRVKEFLYSSSRPCKRRFFMTWISSLESFSRREILTIESLFRSHMDACLLIVSSSMDSQGGLKTLRPFLDRNLKVMAVAPDLDFLFKDTAAATWFDRLKRGRVKPGEISIAQNLSNLLRLALLYKYGGIYMDTDFIILRPLLRLRNAIGAQNWDPRTETWTRLNNAMMIFDKHHPLVEKFIEEFASTFNGNKWGHNGPYLVSRVIKRVTSKFPIGVELNFTVLPPSAFYPVDWGRIGRLFRRPEEEEQWWMTKKELRIKKESYGVHLWNRQTKGLKLEDGSVIARLMLDSCLFCNSTSPALEI